MGAAISYRGAAVSSPEANGVPLIDGTYEILRQHELSDTETLVLATDPDGRPVRIVWYEVAPEQEAAFERHRRVLRRLGREENVLLRDVVSRPGAHFAVWEDVGDAPPAADDAGWHARLAALGLDPARADLRRDGRTPLLAGLGWDPAASGRTYGAAPASGAPYRGPAGGREPGGAAPAHGEPREPGGPWRRIRRRWRGGLSERTRTALVAVLLTLTAAATALVGWERGDNDTMVVVPDLEGAPAQDAADRLARLGLTVVPQARADETETGSVLSTAPAAGTALRPGRDVQLVYALPSDGMATQEVPHLVGRSFGGDSVSRLHEAGLALGAVARVSAALPAGTVLSQRPAAGAHLARGGEVALLVSEGPRPATTFLPDLVGLSEEDARALARVAGLPAERVLADVVATGDAAPGTVVGMTPAPWQVIRADEVTLRLLVASPSAGTGTTAGDGATPDLIGLEAATALELARSSGLTPQVQRLTDARLPNGVVGQDPAPGAAGNGAVRLLVNARPVTLPVPTPTARVLAPRLREVPYRFLIEPGIPEQEVEVRAVTPDGADVLVHRARTSGGSVIEGRWLTTTPGPIRFEVYLNGVFYTETRVSP